MRKREFKHFSKSDNFKPFIPLLTTFPNFGVVKSFEFILSQQETRARLSKRGPVPLGSLLDGDLRSFLPRPCQRQLLIPCPCLYFLSWQKVLSLFTHVVYIGPKDHKFPWRDHKLPWRGEDFVIVSLASARPKIVTRSPAPQVEVPSSAASRSP